jgi:hypothetical protein
MVKSRSMRLTGHVALMGEKSNACRILVETQKEINHYEDQEVGRWIILKWV